MSAAPTTSTPAPLPPEHVIAGHLPGAGWLVEGVFRFDRHLIMMMAFLRQFFPPRHVARVVGAPPCAWTLDLYGRRRPLRPDSCAQIMQVYGESDVGVVLCFDNPLVTGSDTEDAMGHRLVQLLMQPEQNPTGRNAVCVASDALADTLRARYPGLPLICHSNRLVMHAAKRTPELYAKLCEQYHEVMLHPRDAVTPAFLAQPGDKSKYIAVVNDPVPRNYAARRELLQLLAAQRNRPWDLSLAEAKEKMADRTGLFDLKNSGNLTRNEESALYEAGVRTFMVQSFMFRNELTLFWDMFQHLLRTEPELDNKAALIATAAMAYIRDACEEAPSGLSFFSFSDE